MSAVLAQARMELLLTVRRGESVLVTLLIPLGLMIFFASTRMLPAADRNITALLTGTVSLSIISTAMVSLGIATAYERYYGVLKLLGATPLSRWALVAAKLVAVLGLEAVQIAVLCGVAAIFYGWHPSGALPLAALALILGTAAFAGIGLWIAGRVRAELTLGIANGLFLLFLLFGGLFVSVDGLPGVISAVARVLPAHALADVLRDALNGDLEGCSLLVLAAWAVAAPLAAALSFRWE